MIKLSESLKYEALDIVQGSTVEELAECFKVSAELLENEGSFDLFKVEGHDLYVCVRRNTGLYNWCGYLICKNCSKFRECSVHGGWTLDAQFFEQSTAGKQSGLKGDYEIIGFDCAHSGDLTFSLSNLSREMSVLMGLMGSFSSYGTYRTKQYVIEELLNVVQEVLDGDV